jgi:glycolate oxidase iron-sulfur subunit
MQTHFSAEQLADPDMRASEKILRTCVHCGFCTATCPTYVLLGDELDSPRGRIYLMKEMLENNRPATATDVKHIDRCLSCLSCMTTCPSGVNYMHLVDHARRYIEQNHRRPWPDRLLRGVLGLVLPNPALFLWALRGAQLAKPFARLAPARLRAMLALTPKHLPKAGNSGRSQIYPAFGTRRKRVALLTGCAQQVLAPQINEATIRLLTRHGCEVVIPQGGACCGALKHHLGQESLDSARSNVLAWQREMTGGGLDAIIINASGCGTTVKDYGFMLREDAILAEAAMRVAGLAKDITEFIAELGLMPPIIAADMRVAYHSACSLQHGQRVHEAPRQLLKAAGFTVLEIAEAHLCCGSAGTYNILQPEIATQLRDRKLENIGRTAPQAIATGNIGCMTQLATASETPLVHTAELLDWATGGPKPAALAGESDSTDAYQQALTTMAGMLVNVH